jgi:hypothetical protein
VFEVAVCLQERLRAEEIDVALDEACALVEDLDGKVDPQTALCQSLLMMALRAVLHQLDAQVRANRECGSPASFQRALAFEISAAELRRRSPNQDMARRALLERAVYTRAAHLWSQSQDHEQFRSWLARMDNAEQAITFIHIDSGTTREQGLCFLIEELGSPDTPDLLFHTLLA